METFRALMQVYFVVRVQVCVVLFLLASCVHGLPVEQTTPKLGPYVVAGAALDVGLQMAKRPLWQRVPVSVAAAGIVRYSTCCKRPEGAHFGIMFGVSLAEWASLARSVLRK
jgi:hypothetical protein